MKRLHQLRGRLHPWIQVDDEHEDTLQNLPAHIWQRLLKDTDKLTGITRYWFLAGILRAITEMQRTAADGTPLYRTRTELIEHLKTIDRP